MKRSPLSILVLAVLLSACGCGPPEKSGGAKSPSPAKVEKPAGESDLATITLTLQAEERLGIKTVLVESRKVERARTLGGEVLVPPGHALTISAPLAGTLAVPATAGSTPGGRAPAAGQMVRAGEPLFRLAPLLSAEAMVTLSASRVEAEGAVEKGKVAAEATKVAFERAEQLLRDKAGNQRSVDEARAQLLLAQATLKAAEAHRDLLLSVTSAVQAGTISSLAIPAPMDGMLRNVHAVPGQIVAAGAPLFEVFLLDRLWVRLPVYAGDLAGIETEKEARVSRLGEAPGAAGRAARPVPAPPSADAGAASVDLFYELENAGGTLRPGEKVGVTVALRVPEESLVVPWSAVVHDIHGGTWVYELAAPHTFRRRRVEVSYVAGSLATLASGPGPGESVVSEGAAELFGTEFGIGK